MNINMHICIEAQSGEVNDLEDQVFLLSCQAGVKERPGSEISAWRRSRVWG